MTVSLVRFDGSIDSLRRAIELCDGFAKLRSSDRVLIKPNNSFRHPVMPPYGMVTTSRIIDLIIQSLLEHGCPNISIGEGSIIGLLDEFKPYTKRGFRGSGIDKVAAKYGVKLIDFNEGPFEELEWHFEPDGELRNLMRPTSDSGRTHSACYMSIQHSSITGHSVRPLEHIPA